MGEGKGTLVGEMRAKWGSTGFSEVLLHYECSPLLSVITRDNNKYYIACAFSLDARLNLYHL